MNIFRKSFISFSVLSIVLFSGCNNAVTPETPTTQTSTETTTNTTPSSSGNAETVTVFLFNGGEKSTSISVKKGTKVSEITQTEYVTPGTHHFLYWSTSKASSAAAYKNKMDPNTSITEDIILYGIYAPKLATDKAPEANIDENGAGLEIYFQKCDVFSLSNNEVIFNLHLNIIKDNQIVYTTPILNYFLKNDIGSHSETQGGQTKEYLLVYSDMPIPTLAEGSYTLSITNKFGDPINVNNGSFNVSGTNPAKATGESVTVADSYAKVEWNIVLGTTYTVNAKENGAIVSTKFNCVNSATFYGLTNGTTYTFEIITENSEAADKTVTITGKPLITKQSPDWVLAMYMDGDNDLHDSLFADLNEVEYGLWKIDQNPSYSVKAVALWDGWVGNTAKKPTYTIAGSGSCLYEIGPEKSIEVPGDSGGSQVYGDTWNEYTVWNNLSLGPETKNLSYTAKDWLLAGQDIDDITKYSCGEINMGDKQTLINFINWVKARYEPTKGIILQFSNHGGGPRAASNYAILPDGKIQIINQNERKALCWDEASNDAFLKTKNVSYALDTTNFKSIAPESLILMDVCLGASIEDAYQFRNYADYLVASPNVIPGYGMNYIKLMQAFTTSATMESIGKQIIEDYAEFYSGYNWSHMVQRYTGDSSAYNDLSDVQKRALELKYAGYYGVTTLSCIDLSKVADVKTKINSLASAILGYKGYNYNYTNSDNEQVTVKYLNAIRKFGISWPEQLFNNTSLTYEGSFTWLYDIGMFTDTIRAMSSDEDSTAAAALQESLKAAIVSSWHDTKLQNSTASKYANLYSYLQDKSADYEGHYYGLTIAGFSDSTDQNGYYYTPGFVRDWYKTDLDFGVDGVWYNFLSELKNSGE